MKKLIILLAITILAFPALLFGATIVWDAPTGGGIPDGYIVYYTDQTNNYNYDVGNVTECNVDLLNIMPGVEFTFDVTAYNDYGESDHSDSVTWIRDAFIPPVDNILRSQLSHLGLLRL